MEEWTEVRRSFVKTFNKAMKDKDLDLCQTQLDLFCNQYIPQALKVTQADWTLKPLDLKPGTICLLAHSADAKRALGVLNYNKAISEAIPVQYRFEFSILVAKQKALKTEGGKKRKGTVTRIDEGTKNNEQLITPKRGCWFIWKPSLDMHITTENQNWHEPTLIEWYEKFVKGMEQIPSVDEFSRIREHCGFEQFMLTQYPTPAWREHTLTYKKKNKKKIRFVDEEGEAPPPPPPITLFEPPPPLVVEPIGGGGEEEGGGGKKKRGKKRKAALQEEEEDTEPIQLDEEQLALFMKFESMIREIKPTYSPEDLETLINTNEPTTVDPDGNINFTGSPILTNPNEEEEEEVMLV